MTRTLCWIALLLAASELYAQPPQISVEPGINRIGMDYRDIVLPKADFELCRKACAGDSRCRAFTYVKPRVRGAPARCWLKNDVPPATDSACCVSGVKALEQPAVIKEAGPREPLIPDVPVAGLSLSKRPVPRAKTMGVLLADPVTALHLRSIAAAQDRKTVDLAGTSLAGKAVKAEPYAPAEGLKELEMIELDWEAGVQFTPNNRWGQLAVEGMYLPGTKSLGQLYADDQLFVYSKRSSIRWSSVVHPGPGTYAVTVQIRMPTMNAGATDIYLYESDDAGFSVRQIEPLTRLKYADTPAGYVDGIAGLMQLHKTSELKLLIETPSGGIIAEIDAEGAVFSGITITRL